MRTVLLMLSVMLLVSGCKSSDNESEESASRRLEGNPLKNVDANNALPIPTGIFDEGCVQGPVESNKFLETVTGPDNDLRYVSDFVFLYWPGDDTNCEGQPQEDNRSVTELFISGDKVTENGSYLYYNTIESQNNEFYSGYMAYAVVDGVAYLYNPELESESDDDTLNLSEYSEFYNDPVNHPSSTIWLDPSYLE